MYDAIVIGGGPSGLSAALQLGRARRSTLVLDAGNPRNAAATEVHGLIGLDGLSPGELRRRAVGELERYGVEHRSVTADRVEPDDDTFAVHLDGEVVHGRRVLLATGLIDVPPELPDADQFWGTAILQCPFCHGWEVADRPLAFVADAAEDLDRVSFYGNWSSDLTVLTHGRFEIADEQRRDLEDSGVRVLEAEITGLHGEEGKLESVELADGSTVKCEAIFLHPAQQQTPVVQDLGVDVNEGGFVVVEKDYGAPGGPQHVMETSQSGVFAAGDLTSPAQSAVLATFEGSLAGQMILLSLLGV
ncbi:MAG: NAD(P)/FAD-dependent oxidoreductase [Nocardioidaceae bacterium]